MATFGDLKTAASRRLQDDNNTAVSASEVGQAINAAINFWKQKRFWFNEAGGQITLTTGDSALPVSDVLYFLPRYGVRIIQNSSTYDLVQLDPQVYDAVNITMQGRPYGYIWRDGAYRVYYVPDQNYTVYTSYIKDYAPLVDDTDTNDFTTYADQLVLYDAMARLIELRTDPAMLETYAAKAVAEFKNLTARTNKMTRSGRMAGDGRGLNNNYYWRT